MNTIAVKADFSSQPIPFNHFFNAFGYASVDLTYTPAFRRMYDYLSSFSNHGKYMRLHGILTAHGRGDHFWLTTHNDFNLPRITDDPCWDRVVTRDGEGKLTYNWQLVDQVYDIIIAHGMHPIVETCWIPCVALQPGFKPEDWPTRHQPEVWGQIIHDFVAHCQERYGVEEVAQWYFEVWNEPDGLVQWTREPEIFFALYDHMSAAVKAVNPRYRVGGPATMQSDVALKLFREFLQHCANGRNHASGGTGAPLDFISVHCKGGNATDTCPDMNRIFDMLRRYAAILKEFPQFAETEFFNDESDVVWGGSQGLATGNWLNFRNTHYFPGFVCKMMNRYCDIMQDELGINLTIADSDNLHLNWEPGLFSGNRSQLTSLVRYPTTDLLRKAMFNGHRLLSLLGDQRIKPDCEVQGFGEKFGVLPTYSENYLAVMVWNFEDGMDDLVNGRILDLSLANLPLKGKARMVQYRISRHFSNPWQVWHELGQPAEPTLAEIQMLREREGLETFGAVETVDLSSGLNLSLNLPMHTVVLVVLVPESTTPPQTPQWISLNTEKGFNGNTQVFLKWTPNAERNFFHYRLHRRNAGGEGEVLAEYPALNTAVFVDMKVEDGQAYEYCVEAVNLSGISSQPSEWKRVE